MNMDSKPLLIEKGTKYFLQETLRNCNKKRTVYYNNITNLGLLLGFLLILGGIMIYKYKTRPNKEAKKKKEKLKQTYILTKIQSLTDAKNQQQSQSITNLPKFESDFGKLHERCIKENNIKNLKAIVVMYLGGHPEYVKNFYNLKRKYK